MQEQKKYCPHEESTEEWALDNQNKQRDSDIGLWWAKNIWLFIELFKNNYCLRGREHGSNDYKLIE